MANSQVSGNPRIFKCSNSGAPKSKDGRVSPRANTAPVVHEENELAGPITPLLDQKSNDHLFHLLMTGCEALEFLNIGMVLTTASAQVLMANGIAEHILAKRDGLELSASGVLRTQGECIPSLPDLIQQIAGSRELESHDVVVAIPRPSGKRPLTLLARSAGKTSLHPGSAGPAALVFLLDPVLPIQSAEAQLQQLYGFTFAEARLANLLMDGKSLEDCCSELEVGRPTVCSHLQHLFRKTGVKRQSELVSVLFKSVGLIFTGGTDSRTRFE